MSTPGTPGVQSQPASGWYPQLDGYGLPRPLTQAMQQIYSLVYSLRDTVNQGSTTTAKIAQYGTNKERTNVNPQAVPDGSLWLETDTGDVYQSRLGAKQTTRIWVLVAHGVAQT
jgi:hypothetical protein